MASYAYSAAVKGVLLRDDAGAIRLVVLQRPSPAILSEWEALYPALPILEAVNDTWPQE